MILFGWYYSFRCPVCREVAARSWSQVLIGPPEALCRHCGNTYTGSCCEWWQMDGKQRREVLVPDMVQIWIAVIVLIIAYLGATVSGPRAWLVLGQLLLILLTPIAVFYVMRFVQIRRSIARRAR